MLCIFVRRWHIYTSLRTVWTGITTFSVFCLRPGCRLKSIAENSRLKLTFKTAYTTGLQALFTKTSNWTITTNEVMTCVYCDWLKSRYMKTMWYGNQQKPNNTTTIISIRTVFPWSRVDTEMRHKLGTVKRKYFVPTPFLSRIKMKCRNKANINLSWQKKTHKIYHGQI